MNIYLVALSILAISVILALLSYAYIILRHPDRAQIRKKLRKVTYQSQHLTELTDITRKNSFSDIPFLDRLLKNATFAHKMQRLLYQANAKYSAGFYIMLMLFLGFTGFDLFYFLNYVVHPMPLLGGLFLGATPLIYLRLKKQKRMDKFLHQLPEALDMIASSMRAGHAFSTGMRMVADEYDDPLGPEFTTTLNEINYGAAMSDALHKMTDRVTCYDLNFFVVAVILQRETGGNLVQIIEGISTLIRDRFKLHGKIRALTAEGNLSMYVLIVLPFAMAGILSFLNRSYIDILFEDPIGRIMIGIAMVMMVLGAVVMRKLVRIKV